MDRKRRRTDEKVTVQGKGTDLKGWFWRKRRKKGMRKDRREATERREGGDDGQREVRKRCNMIKCVFEKKKQGRE